MIREEIAVRYGAPRSGLARLLGVLHAHLGDLLQDPTVSAAKIQTLVY
jgi:hypothetical protein